MSAGATFTHTSGADAASALHLTIAALTTVTVGDALYVGQGFRSRIRERTFSGVDVNGAPFAAYSTRGPFYLYLNKGATGDRAARATASKNRYAKTGKIGIRTATGIKYESYAAAQAAHGVNGVTLYGMEQHPHMLDAMMVKAGGSEIGGAGLPSFGSEFEAFEGNTPCSTLTIGFYGDEEGRARGNNEGNSNLPKREFFALNQSDIAWGEKSLGERMEIRARARG